MYVVLGCLLLFIIGLIVGLKLVKRTELWRIVEHSSPKDRWEIFEETRRRLKRK